MRLRAGSYYNFRNAVAILVFFIFFDAEFVLSSSYIKRNYDTLHIGLQLLLNEREKTLTGIATLTIVPLDSQFSQCQFHAKEMEIRNVLLSSSEAVRFHSDSNKIYIDLDDSYSPRDTLQLTVSYVTKPQKGVYFNIPSEKLDGKHLQVYSHSEPTDARYWYPCYDAPDDKLTSEIEATVNEKLTVVSNGALIEIHHNPETRTKTFHWKQTKPHANYLISFAAGEFHVVSDYYQSIPVNYYVYPDNFENAACCFGKTPEMMAVFSGLFDYPYPWEKYDQVLINGYISRGMEHTSATTMSDEIMHDSRTHLDRNCDALVSHELAHQWFGNLVTCKSWPHIWLNEGFATYAEILFTEADQGDDAAKFALYLQRNAYFRSEDQDFMQPIVYYYYTHPREMFSHVTYQKASLVLHMLRNQIGDEMFFNALSTCLRQFAFQSITTDDFVKVVEAVTAQDLKWFFDQWLNHGGYPSLSVRYEWNQLDKQVILNIEQIQESVAPIFKFPVDIKIVANGSARYHKIFLESRSHTFRLPADVEPAMVLFDPAHILLKKIDFKKSQKESLFQLQHDVNLIGRLDAIESLIEMAKDTAVVVDGLISALS
ncbi:M1 family metallopeptidase, partial [bacterium]|nr:M1 family metallopeptidase [candidate division CSSED10-310 bacterium]